MKQDEVLSTVEINAEKMVKLATTTDHDGLATTARAGAEALLDVLDAIVGQEVESLS